MSHKRRTEKKMNITAFNMYLLTRLDYIRLLLWVGVTVSVITLVIVLANVYVFNERYYDSEEQDKTGMQWTKRCAIMFSICMLGIAFVPSTKDMLAIFGVPALLQSRAVQKDLPDLYGKLVERLMKQLDTPKEKGK